MKYFLNCLLSLVGIFCILLANSGIVLAASSPFLQTDWSGGSGQASFSDVTRFDSSSNVTTSNAGEITLAATSGWYNSSWGYRKEITFDNASQTDNLVNFPVLVSLTASNFDYAKAKSAGEDIRFTDSNGTTLLDYEIERWDAAGTSLVWVEVPQIDGASDTDSIYLYYGNSSATDGQNAAGVWNSNAVMVQHFEETGNCPASFADSTSNNNDGTCDGTDSTANASGKINGARTFDGSDDLVRVTSSSSLQPTTGLTVSTWINADSYTNWNKLVSSPYRNDGSWTGPYVSYALGFHNNAGGVLFEITTGGSKADTFNTVPNLNTGQWYHLVGTYDGTTMRLYIDGVENATTGKTGDIDYNGSTNDIAIGRASPYVNENPFDGTMDEVRIYNQAMSPDWIAASYESENNTFNTYGSEEAQYASSGTLTSSIFDTTDAETWGGLTFSATTPTDTTATVKVRTSNAADMSGATAFGSCIAISSGSDISGNSCVTDGHRYVQYQIGLGTTGTQTPTFAEIAIAFTTPAPAPSPSSSSSSTSAPAPQSPPSCDNTTPPKAPEITRYLTGETSADVYFSKVEGVVKEYVISYGYDSGASNFSGSFGAPDEPVIKQSIKNLSSGTTFYIKVRAGNGCATGPWSEVVKVTTTGARSSSASISRPVESSSSSKLTQILQPLKPAASASPVSSMSPKPAEIASAPIPQASTGPDFSFFIPKFEFIDAIGQSFASFGSSVGSQIASLYNGIFNPEPLMITEVKVGERGEDYVVVTWKTNIPATSKVNFGDSYDYGRDFQSMEKVTEHSVRVEGLVKGKTYYYEVMSQNGGRYSFDARHEFKLE